MATCRQRIAAATRWTLLTLTVMVAVAWPLSRWWAVGWRSNAGYDASIASGSLWMHREQFPASEDRGLPVGSFLVENPYGRRDGMNWRFEHGKVPGLEIVIVPLWLVAPPVVALTTLAWRKQVRAAVKRDGPRARRKRGACVSCGYDRRGLPREGGCPECGSVPAA